MTTTTALFPIRNDGQEWEEYFAELEATAQNAIGPKPEMDKGEEITFKERFDAYYPLARAWERSKAQYYAPTVKAIVTSIIQTLSVKPIIEISVSYSGAGDSGEINSYEVEFADDKERRDASRELWTEAYARTDDRNHDDCIAARAIQNSVYSDQQDFVKANQYVFDQLGEYCWMLAYSEHPGFEISDGCADGANGEFIFKLNDEGEVVLTGEHRQHYIQTEESSYEF